jgi:phospholipase D1/2
MIPQTEKIGSSLASESVNDRTIGAELRTLTDKVVPGFSNSIIPTLEGTTGAGHIPPMNGTDKTHKLQRQTKDEKSYKETKWKGCIHNVANGKPPEAQAEDERVKVTQIVDQPPRASGEIDDGDEEDEKVATGTRATNRKPVNHNTWALSSPRPHVVPEGFEDPISDTFWKDVWIASALYNVRIYIFLFNVVLSSRILDGNLSKGLPCDS